MFSVDKIMLYVDIELSRNMTTLKYGKLTEKDRATLRCLIGQRLDDLLALAYEPNADESDTKEYEALIALGRKMLSAYVEKLPAKLTNEEIGAE